MPRIFEKDCKINVIEYGENCKDTINLAAFYSMIMLPFKTFFKA